MVPHQVAATARNRELITKAELTFATWMRQMKSVVMESQQVRKDSSDVGPLDELEYWRSMLAKFSSITEFVATKEFNNFHKALKLSKSKWVQKWKEIDNSITCALNIASDNVRYLSSMERFWQPLYTAAPAEIQNCLPSLLLTVKSVYKTSNYYNTSINVTSFIVKVTNQLIIACRNHLTKNYTESIWKQETVSILNKIQECKELDAYYRSCYFKTVQDMEEAEDETPWDCSIKFIFGKFEKFSLRLDQVDIFFSQPSPLFSKSPLSSDP